MTPLESRVAALERQVAVLAELLNTTTVAINAKVAQRICQTVTDTPRTGRT